MNKPLVSIVIASRNRFDRLKASVQSFLDTASHDNMEFIIRLHTSVAQDWNRRDELLNMGSDVQLRVVGGRDLAPGEGCEDLFNEVADMAIGTWTWAWSDDQTISGKDWDKQLAEVPTSGFIVLPEIHKLNQSVYVQSLDGCGPTPCIPNGCIQRMGGKANLADIAIDQFLRLKCGWKIHLLKGVQMFHDRRIDDTLPKEKY